MKRRVLAYVEALLLLWMMGLMAYLLHTLAGGPTEVILVAIPIMFLFIQMVLTQFEVTRLNREVAKLRAEMHGEE
jgi:hypothetical protein